MNRLLYIAAVALIAALGVFAWQATRPAQTAESLLPLGAANAQEGGVDTSIVEEMSLGNPDAAVTVVEYASFTCPHCANFHKGTFKDLKSDYIDTGKIHFIYREVYFDRLGLWAGMVARCGGSDRYFGLVDLIYDAQSEWTKGESPAAIADNLRRLGRTAGLSDAEVEACLQDADKAQALVAVYQKNAGADNVDSTPTFVINGKKHRNMPYDEFRAVIEEELGS